MDQTLLPIAAFVAVLSAVGAVLFGLRDLFSSQEKKRLELKQLVRILPKDTDRDSQGGVQRFDRWFTLLLYQSGLGLAAGAAVMFFALCAIGTGGFVFVLTEEAPVSILAGLLMMPGVMGILVGIRRRRMKKFEEQFPNSLDILARAVRAGESVEQAIELVSKSTQEPVASEYRRCSNQLEMGLSVPATVQSLGDRIGQSDVKIFSSTLAIHRDGGGNLAEALEPGRDVAPTPRWGAGGRVRDRFAEGLAGGVAEVEAVADAPLVRFELESPPPHALHDTRHDRPDAHVGTVDAEPAEPPYGRVAPVVVDDGVGLGPV